MSSLVWNNNADKQFLTKLSENFVQLLRNSIHHLAIPLFHRQHFANIEIFRAISSSLEHSIAKRNLISMPNATSHDRAFVCCNSHAILDDRDRLVVFSIYLSIVSRIFIRSRSHFYWSPQCWTMKLKKGPRPRSGFIHGELR